MRKTHATGIIAFSCLIALVCSESDRSNECTDYAAKGVTHAGSMGFDYGYMCYCTLAGYEFFSILLLLAWVIVLIFFLCDTADNYFSPTLAAVCDRLDLSPEVAGVTFLAFGNGAPDVFSSIAATAVSRSAENVLVGIGALLGGCMFIITIVMGSVIYSQPKNSSIKILRVVFLRDAVFLIAALLLVAFCGSRRTVSVYSASAFVAIYASYVYSVFWVDRISRQRYEQDRCELPGPSDVVEAFWHEDHDPRQSVQSSPCGSEDERKSIRSSSSSSSSTQYGTQTFPLLSRTFSAPIRDEYFEPEPLAMTSLEVESIAALPGSSLAHCFDGDRVSSWNETADFAELAVPLVGKVQMTSVGRLWKNLYWQHWRLRRRAARDVSVALTSLSSGGVARKVVHVLKLPVTVARSLTIVQIEYESWNQLQAIVCAFFVPLFLMWVCGGRGVAVAGVPLWIVSAAAGVACAACIKLMTHRSRPPTQPLLSFVLVFSAFSCCIAWIFMMASEVVAALETIGVVTSIPSSILGLTVLAWGNSSADLVTNIAVSKAGRPSMAMAGCLGGPLFNILIGLGVTLVPTTVSSYPEPISFQLDAATWMTVAFALVAVGIAIVSVVTAGGSVPHRVASVLFSVYTVYAVAQVIQQLVSQVKA